MGKSSVEIQGCGSRAGFLHGIMAYLAAPVSFALNTEAIACNRLNAWWFTPGTGRSALIASNFANSGKLPLEKQPGEPDAVVVVDSAAKHYPPPGHAL